MSCGSELIRHSAAAASRSPLCDLWFGASRGVARERHSDHGQVVDFGRRLIELLVAKWVLRLLLVRPRFGFFVSNPFAVARRWHSDPLSAIESGWEAKHDALAGDNRRRIWFRPEREAIRMAASERSPCGPRSARRGATRGPTGAQLGRNRARPPSHSDPSNRFLRRR